MKHFLWLTLAGAQALIIGCSDGHAPTPPTASYDGGWSITLDGDLNDFFDCLDDADRALVSAHRGGPLPGLPENALETVQATLGAVPALMEVDVAQSSDGILFLMHDDSLERTTTGAGEASEMAWADLQKLRLEDEEGNATNFKPPAFSDILAWAKTRTILQIDFKRSARYEDVISEIYRQDAEDRVILIAYSMASAQKLHRLAPDMMISLSVSSQSDLNRAVAAGIPENRLLAFTGIEEPQPRLFRLIDQRRVEGIFGTLGGSSSIDAEIARTGDEARYGEIAAMGADIIATDRPREAHAALAAAGRAPSDGLCGVKKG